MPLPKDPLKAEETRTKMCEASRKKWGDPEYRKRMSKLHTGKKQSKETIEKRISKIKGRPRSSRIKKNCAFCGKELELAEWEKNRKFCSTVCKGKWQSKTAIGEKSSHWQGGDLIKKCEECGKDFKIEKYRKKMARFCSPSCKGTWMAKNGLTQKYTQNEGRKSSPMERGKSHQKM